MGATTSNNSCRLIVFAPQWITDFSVCQNSTRTAPSAPAAPEQSSTNAAPAQLMGKRSKCQEKQASYCDPDDGPGRYCMQCASTMSGVVRCRAGRGDNSIASVDAG